MARPSVRSIRSCFVSLFFCWLVASAFGAGAFAQSPSPLNGVVIDESGGVVPGARVTASDAKGTVVQATTTDGAGAFSLRGLAAGTYSINIERNRFAPAAQTVTVGGATAASALRVVLKPGGFAQSVVVTAHRIETRLAETPQKVELVDATDIERAVAADVTDVLKKNSGVDVIQYNGQLSGIGIRGFRPQTSGINKRSLLLIDGRPSGVVNLATLMLDDVERIEVVKGAASALYGSSAVGGVVNVITRASQGKLGGTAQVGAASFGGSNLSGRLGGNVLPRLDVDLSGATVDQRDDFRMGNGVVRPATNFMTYDGALRAGFDLENGWRVEGHARAYRGRDIYTSPDLATGIVGQGRKNLEQSSQDARLTGRIREHAVSFTAYHAQDANHTFNVTTFDPTDAPYLPYLTFESDLSWAGVQARDSWRWSPRGEIVAGVDVEHVTSVTRSYDRTGPRIAPFSADANKHTVGVYAEHTLRLMDGRTIVAVGGRLDRITTATLDTPLKTNFTPSETTFNVFNPSLGVKHEIINGLRGHFTIGRAFIPAEASMLTGSTTGTVGGRAQIIQGNPDLKPEHSISYDAGAEWTSTTTRLDVTAFHTLVKDRFISNVVISNPAPPDPIVVSIANGLDAHITGLDVDAEQRVGRYLGVFGGVTHYFTRKEKLLSGAEQDILNVALNTVRAGVDIDINRIKARIAGRYVQGRRDNDFNAPGFPIVTYDDFTAVDASVTYQLAGRHAVVLAISNMFDAFYYEKLGYPQPGAAFRLSYRVGF